MPRLLCEAWVHLPRWTGKDRGRDTEVGREISEMDEIETKKERTECNGERQTDRQGWGGMSLSS